MTAMKGYITVTFRIYEEDRHVLSRLIIAATAAVFQKRGRGGSKKGTV
jgi:hypothetical protein